MAGSERAWHVTLPFADMHHRGSIVLLYNVCHRRPWQVCILERDRLVTVQHVRVNLCMFRSTHRVPDKWTHNSDAEAVVEVKKTVVYLLCC